MSASTARRLWLPEENRVIDRYAQALAAGRYRYLRDATTACLVELDRLYARIRRSTPDHLVAATGRTRVVVRARFRELLRERGLSWGGSRLREAESRLVKRYALALTQGRFPDALRAAEECLADIRRLPPEARTLKPRSLHTIHCGVLTEAHRTRRIWFGARWAGKDDKVVRRFGTALAQGEYPSAAAAAAACRRELRLSAARARPPNSVMVRLILWAHRSGWVRFGVPWNDKEHAVMDRVLRDFYEGRYAGTSSAARACHRQLKLLHRRASSQSDSKTLPRTLCATRQEMLRRARSLGLPRSHVEWTEAENVVVLKYARAVDGGLLPDWRSGARKCMDELGHLYAAKGRSSAIHARKLTGRSLESVHQRMMKLAHQHGLRGPVKPPPWSMAEVRVLQQWLRWYDRYRSSRHRLGPAPLATAASGLQEELEKKGFSRTASACRSRLKNGWLQMHGLA